MAHYLTYNIPDPFNTAEEWAAWHNCDLTNATLFELEIEKHSLLTAVSQELAHVDRTGKLTMLPRNPRPVPALTWFYNRLEVIDDMMGRK